MKIKAHKTRLDKSLLDHYYGMVAVDETLVLLEAHLPRDSGAGRQPEWETMVHTPWNADLNSTAFDQLKKCLKQFVALPVPTNHATAANLERLKRLHKSSADFWEMLSASRKEAFRTSSHSQSYVDQSMDNLQWYKSKQQLDEIDKLCSKLSEDFSKKEGTANNKNKLSKGLALPSAPTQTVWARGTEAEHLQPPEAKIKVKTRATAVDQTDHEHNQASEHEEQDPPSATKPTIAVNATSMHIFESMFSSFGEARAPVKWKALLAALTDAGLSAMHSGGSVVTFAHVEKGSVAIHEPHPEPDLGVVKLRWIGKRLRKWFGWEAETFVEAEVRCAGAAMPKTVQGL